VSLCRPLARLGVLTALIAVALVAGIGVASAHVSVSSSDAAAGGFGKITFRVPNESDTASTVSVKIQIPPKTPLASLSTQPLPGWTVTRTESDLSEPIQVEGQEVSSYTSVVEFRAASGGGIKPGEFQEFSLSGGPFPDAAAITFNVVQSYSDGSESAWIEPTVEGQAEPEHPAPVLTLSRGDGAASSGDGSGSGTAPTDGASAGQAAGGGAPVGLTLFLAILALLTGIAGCVLGWRAYRRTVSS
jgi:periplasmic copper chaperone A